jgi:starch phosphorylase
LTPVVPKRLEGVPGEFGRLVELATNFWWSWNPDARGVFSRLAGGDAALSSLGSIGAILDVRDWAPWLADAAFRTEVERLAAEMDHYLASAPADGGGTIAYFCAEYALHESFGHYAGGLGILAGDHCKEASDLGIPLIGIGLFYRRGFFRQMLDWEGRQEHVYQTFEPGRWPVERVLARSGDPLTIVLELPGRELKLAVWRVAVGRVAVILLDSDLPENLAADRPITSQLYTNGREMRLYQEMVLGVGGARALAALGIEPAVWHLNEGHSAMCLLERVRGLVAGGQTLAAAQRTVTANSILTIHTPVPEGNERFDAKLATSLIEPVLAGSGVAVADALAAGLGADADPSVFDMTAFALRHAKVANGVSQLHGKTADKTWRPVTGHHVLGVTNGVHMPTWLGPEIAALFGRFGCDVGAAGASLEASWEGVEAIPDEELWQAHLAQKRRMVASLRERLLAQHARHGEGPSELAGLAEALEAETDLSRVLWIGFSRRFATYKRAGLVFSDRRQARRVFGDPGRPVRIALAGKSHPSDRGGQKLISKVYASTVSPAFRGRAFVVEDYDMALGAALVQGSDVWLNNPRRPLEASGTSGMKAAANGVPNASILDGWWDEGFVGGKDRNGWAIGGAKVPKTEAEQDRADAEALYSTLLNEVIPTFFDRDEAGVPRKWVRVMKRSIATSLFRFSTGRMWRDYLAIFPRG